MQVITKGHIYFAIAFVILFAVVLIILYVKDRKMHKRNYKNSWQVILIVAVLFILFLFFKNWLIKI